MTNNWQFIMDSYLKWIKDNTFIDTISENKVGKITVPFMDRNNDHLEIYALNKDGKIILTDDGYTIDDLKMSGMEINTPKRQELFNKIINTHGIKSDENLNLYIEANPNNVGQKKHRLIQAILAINDMHSLSQENVFSLFKEDVEIFFKSEEVLFSKDIKITGKTGFDYNIDFIIPASKTKLERLIKTINIAKKDTVTGAIFAFEDIAQIRDQKTDNFVFYNDIAYKPSQDIDEAFKSYGVTGIPWSQREANLQKFLV